MFGINIIENSSVTSSGVSDAIINRVKTGLELAADQWGRYIDAPDAVIDIELRFEDLPDTTLASAGGFFFSTGGGEFEASVTQELADNRDISPSSADAIMTFNVNNLRDPDFYFFDDSFEADPAGLTDRQFDFLSIAIHELGHILGLITASDFVTPFARLTETIGGVESFIGTNTVAANGGEPLALSGPHIAEEDLLDPSIRMGQRGIITPTHIAIWEDLGIPITTASAMADELFGFERENDEIDGGAGNDVISGLTGDDILRGGGGADRLIGGGGADTLDGGGGNDTLVADRLDLLDGGTGTDTADFSELVERIIADLDIETAGSRQTGSGTSGSSQNGALLSTSPELGGRPINGVNLVDIENLIGTGFNDILLGNNEANVIEAGGGNDTVNGFDGNDFLSGGAGSDTIVFSDASGGVTVDLNNQLSETDFQAAVAGGAAAFAATGGAGNNVLSGFENITGSQNDDRLTGDDNDNVIIGGSGNDILIAGAGNDTLNGGDGFDTADFSGRDVVVDLDDDGNGTVTEIIGGVTQTNRLISIENVLLDGDEVTFIDDESFTASAEDFDGRTFIGIDDGDRLILENLPAFSTSDLAVSGRDITVSGITFQVDGDLDSGNFLAAGAGDTTTLQFIDELLGNGRDLEEGVAVNSGDIDGISFKEFITGTGRADFTVTLNEADALFENALGVFEFDAATNTVSDVRIIFDNVRETGAGASATIADVSDGAELGFFLIQNGADIAAGLSDTLTFDFSGGTAVLRDNGSAVDAEIFVSTDRSLNSDNLEHFLSGTVDGGGALRVGVEDLTGNGDSDFQDIVFVINRDDDFTII